MIWAHLLHLSFNMWEDRDEPALEGLEYGSIRCYRPFLTFDDELWRKLIERMANVGINMLVIDLGDGVKYESHPEIAVKGAWSTAKLCNELSLLRELDIEPIPKLNFATSHDTWMGEYSRRVSTPEYYTVCADLIEEVSELFSTPRYFHLGMDEETAEHQRYYAYAVLRQHDLWWHDLGFLCDKVREFGSTPWIWSDHIWRHRDEFLDNVSRDIVQSNWYYGDGFESENSEVAAYSWLEEAGFYQIPAASNHASRVNLKGTVDHCSKIIAPERLKGFLQTVWRPTIPQYAERHVQAIDQVGEVIRSRK